MTENDEVQFTNSRFFQNSHAIPEISHIFPKHLHAKLSCLKEDSLRYS
jgi:hypothetical protein